MVTRPSANARIDALRAVTEQLMSDGQLLLAQQGINVRTGNRLDGHEAVLAEHGRELSAHDRAIKGLANDVGGAREATAVVATAVTDHESRLSVVERLRSHNLPAAGWVAVILLTTAFWWLFNAAAHWLATPTSLQDGTIVVWPQLAGWKLVAINVAIILAAAGLAYGIIGLICSSRRTATTSASSTTTAAAAGAAAVAVSPAGPPQLQVVQGGGGAPAPTQPLPMAASGAPAP